MPDSYIQTGDVEPLQFYVIDASGDPYTGLTNLVVRVLRVSDSELLDWDDMTFKPSGHTTLNQALSEVDAVNTPGIYSTSIDTDAIVNPTSDDTYVIVLDEIPAGDAVLPGPGELQVGSWADAESNIRGADNDTLKTLSDHLDIIVPPGGARSIVIDTEEADTTTIPEATVTIWQEAAHTNLVARVQTDAAGRYTLGLDDGTYYYTAVKAWYSFVPGSFVVSADATKTVTGVGSAPPAPSAPDLCVIYGYVYDAAGEPIAGACVEAFATTPQVTGGVQVGKRVAHTGTNTAGYFELELTKLGEVYFKIEDTGLDTILTVPDAISQDIATWT